MGRISICGPNEVLKVSFQALQIAETTSDLAFCFYYLI